ncbi:MAG: hypothetical protein WBC40_07790 [Halobacteriota archaeon]
MGSKFIAALKCFFKCPADTMRLMLTLDSYESKAVDTIKTHCPGIDVERVGFYAGLFLAIAFLAFCVMAYILSLLYGMGGI